MRTKTTLVMALLVPLVMPALAACGETSAPASPTATTGETAETAAAVAETPITRPTQGTSDGWTTFTSQTDGFSVDMPGEPQASTQSTDSPVGDVTFYFYQVTDGPAQYAAAYCDYPVETADLDADMILQDAIQGAAQGFEVANMQAVDVQGNPGIEGEINPPGTYVWFRGMLVENRLYQLIVSAPEAQKELYDSDARRFIESFTLLNP
ncbi:MAG TPA: hypothetical protein VLQ48_01250 [Chloroflexia bacterium]|nr:hypothetical protein [Chloroflexia bacterium]